jgi:hypothetical protein
MSNPNPNISPGERFGLLTIIKRQGSNKYRQSVYLCKCDCGNEHVVGGRFLRRGSTRSCGCMLKKMRTENRSRRFKSPYKE